MKILERIIHYPKIGLVLLAYVAFIALGMPDGLLGVAWPSIRTSFSLPLEALGTLLPATTAGYLTSSFASGPLMSRWGVGRVLVISCAMTGVALLGYTLIPAWWMIVPLGILAGLGAGAIDSGLNSYVAAYFGEGVMQWLHACYGIGVTIGPVIMTVALATYNSWRLGFRVVSGFQLLLAICFIATLSIWQQKATSAGRDEPKRLTDYKTPMLKTLQQPSSWLSAFLFFLYVGIEVSLGTWTYSLMVESRGLDPEIAGLVTGGYWAMFTAGRVIAGLFAKRVGVNQLVQTSIVAALAGALLLLWNPFDWMNFLAVAFAGFSIAPIFPALISGTSRRVGAQHAANVIGMQMAASGLGGAIIPSLLGLLAGRFTLEVIPICLIVVLILLLGFFRLSRIPRTHLSIETP